MRYRYPGPKPFTEKDEDLFFGRQEEKLSLNTVVKTNKLTILFGRSGYGKSSLIQAGVIPEFKRNLHYKVIEIRFSYTSEKSRKPTNLRIQLLEEFKKLIKGEIFLSDLQSNIDKASFWQLFKTIQWEAKNEDYEGVLLILDQFEEIFQFIKRQYDGLARELAELIYNKMPEFLQEELMERIEDDKYCEENRERIDFIKNELPVSYLIGIRSDRLYLLDEFGSTIPTIFENRYKLEQLQIDKIDSIIKEPALRDGDYFSPKFKYEPEVIEKIRGFFLGKEEYGGESKTIEAFELQIICQYIEDIIIYKIRDGQLKFDSNISVDSSYLPGDLDEIIKTYYFNIVTGKSASTEGFSAFQLLITRYLIEKKLIDRKTGSRICLDKTSIMPLGFDDELLVKLTETRIVRRELNTVSGQSYEISHDTLVRPIQDMSKSYVLSDSSRAISEYYNISWRKGKQGIFSFQLRSLEKVFLDKHNSVRYFTDREYEQTIRNKRLVAQLKTDNILKVSDDSPDKYILNEVFEDAVTARIKSFDFTNLKRLAVVLILSFILIGIVVILFKKALDLSERERTERVVANIPILDSDSNEIKLEKLQVFNAVFNDFSRYPQRQVSVRNSLIEQFNKLYLYAHEIYRPDKIPGRFDISSGDSLIVVTFTDMSKQSSGSGGRSQMILFDKKGNPLDSMYDVTSAVFLKPENELILLVHDSLLFYRSKTKVKIFLPENQDLISFVPLLKINNNLLYGRTQILNHQAGGTTNYQTPGAVVNLINGKLTSLQEGYVEKIFIRKNKMGFVKQDPVKERIVLLDDLGSTQKIYQYKDFPGSIYLNLPDSRTRLDGIITRTYNGGSFSYSYNQIDPLFSNTNVDTLTYYSFDKSIQPICRIIPSIISLSYDYYNYLIAVSTDSVRIFDEHLKQLTTFPMQKMNAPSFVVSLDISHRNVLFSKSDSVILFRRGNDSVQEAKTPQKTYSAVYSANQKMIYCLSTLQGNNTDLAILDRNFKIVGKINSVQLNNIYPENNLIVFYNKNKLMIVDPETDFKDLNNTDARQISEWMNKNKPIQNNDLLRKYGVSASFMDELKYLGNE